VKKMQEQMLKAQEELGDKVIEGSSGGGVVTVQVNGHKKSNFPKHQTRSS